MFLGVGPSVGEVLALGSEQDSREAYGVGNGVCFVGRRDDLEESFGVAAEKPKVAGLPYSSQV